MNGMSSCAELSTKGMNDLLVIPVILHNDLISHARRKLIQVGDGGKHVGFLSLLCNGHDSASN